MRMTNRVLAALVALVFAFVLAGCGDEDMADNKPGVSDYEAERAQLANRDKGAKKSKRGKGKKGKGKKSAKKKGSGSGTGYASGGQDYFYDPRGKRDPFRSIRFLNADEQEVPAGPLEGFELAQLELSAVIWDHDNPRALILDPGGRSYIVREGASIGKNKGQVIHIGDNLVLVKETYENFAGEQTTKDVELRIRLSQGG